MGTEIFLPMFYLVLLTTVVFLFATSLRLKEIYLDKILKKKGVDGEEFRHPPFETGSITLKFEKKYYSFLETEHRHGHGHSGHGHGHSGHTCDIIGHR